MKKRLCSFLLSMVLLLGLLPTAALAESEEPLTADAKDVFGYVYNEDKWFSSVQPLQLIPKDGWTVVLSSNVTFKDDVYTLKYLSSGENETVNVQVYRDDDDSFYYDVTLRYNYDGDCPNVEVLTYKHNEFHAEWPKNWVVLDISDHFSGVDTDKVFYYCSGDETEQQYRVSLQNDLFYFIPTKTGQYIIYVFDLLGNHGARTVNIDQIYTAPKPKPSVSAPAALPVTVPVSGEENTVHLSAEITGQSAKLGAVNAEEVAHVSEGLLPAPLTMDLSAVKRPITSLTIPAESMELIAGASESGNVTELEIKLPGAALTFDKAALQNIAYAAEDAREITLRLQKTTPNKLSTAQQETLAAMPGTMIWEISLLVGKEELHYFGSGTVRVEIPYESASPYLTVRHLAEDGSAEPLPTRHARNTLSFTTPHFSHFILTEDETNYRHLCPNAYSDIHPKQWHHAGVDYVVENGIMGGYSDGSFRPAASTTRAQIATMLWRLSGKPVVNYLMTFRDVKAEQYYTEAVRWAAAEGIMGGYDSNYFGTHDPVTREQLAAILWRFAKYAGKDVSVGEDTNILSYNDVFDMSEYAIPAMQWACGSGVIMGKDVSGGGMVLLPKNNATRGEIAVMLMRFAEGMR